MSLISIRTDTDNHLTCPALSNRQWRCDTGRTRTPPFRGCPVVRSTRAPKCWACLQAFHNKGGQVVDGKPAGPSWNIPDAGGAEPRCFTLGQVFQIDNQKGVDHV